MDPGRERHCDKSHKRHVIMMLVALLDLSLINFVALLGWLFISFVALLGLSHQDVCHIMTFVANYDVCCLQGSSQYQTIGAKFCKIKLQLVENLLTPCFDPVQNVDIGGDIHQYKAPVTVIQKAVCCEGKHVGSYIRKLLCNFNHRRRIKTEGKCGNGNYKSC